MCLILERLDLCLEDAAQSKVAGKMGYAMIPAGRAGQLHPNRRSVVLRSRNLRTPRPPTPFVEWMRGPRTRFVNRRWVEKRPRDHQPTWIGCKAAMDIDERSGAPAHPSSEMLYNDSWSLQIGGHPTRDLRRPRESKACEACSLTGRPSKSRSLVGDKASLRYPPSN